MMTSPIEAWGGGGDDQDPAAGGRRIVGRAEGGDAAGRLRRRWRRPRGLSKPTS
jgi:hypothetical protein